jgi:hypothetical protein
MTNLQLYACSINTSADTSHHEQHGDKEDSPTVLYRHLQGKMRLLPSHRPTCLSAHTVSRLKLRLHQSLNNTTSPLLVMYEAALSITTRMSIPALRATLT